MAVTAVAEVVGRDEEFATVQRFLGAATGSTHAFSPDAENIVNSSVQPGIGAVVMIASLDGQVLGTPGSGLFPDWQPVPEADDTPLRGYDDSATAGSVDGNAENDG